MISDGEIANDTASCTFWQLLSSRRIVIPIIQRDYAQGRRGKEYIRRSFLKQLGDAVLRGEPILLDFIYGTEFRPMSNGTIEMQPLDGQQRLTTLWLLHWYVAYKAGKLADPVVADTLRRFTYETRVSSREFCTQLCDLRDVATGEHIADFITGQTWFFSSWKQDPTIQAMLRMLNGTDCEGEADDIGCDGLEKLFQKQSMEEFATCWERLTRRDAPIRFHFLSLNSKELPAADSLYIKMNARGKLLTDFENFKADLIDWVQNERFPDPLEVATLAGLIDNEWTDIFWEENKQHCRVDEAFFAFLNRYCFNAAVLAGSQDGSLAWRLSGDHFDDSRNSYEGFQLYQNIISLELLQNLQTLFAHLKEVSPGKIVECLPTWFREREEKFCFIPRYSSEKRPKQKSSDDGEVVVEELTQPQRVVFHAICRYLEQNVFDETVFSRWMRVVCNLVANSILRTADSMIARLKLIDELGKHAGEIYEYLARNANLNSKSAEEQLTEETKKAGKIMDPQYGAQWEKLILRLENHPLLHGKIAALLWTEETTPDTWEEWIEKFENFLSPKLSEEEFAERGRQLLMYGDYSVGAGDNEIFGTSRGCWEELFHVTGWQVRDKVRQVLMEWLAGRTKEYSCDQWEYYFTRPDYAKYFLEPDCRRYRWTDNPFCIYKMTCLVLNGSHCNPFLAAIADDQNERFNFMRSSRAGDGRIHIDDTTSFWIEEDCFQVESELDLTAQNDNWQQEKQIWKWKILPGTDLIQQGREVLKWLCDNCRIPGEESE